MAIDTTAATTASVYLKLCSLAIWFYDYCLTIPAEYSLYKRQMQQTRYTRAFWLLIAVRYLGAIAVISNSAGYFAAQHSSGSCLAYHSWAPVTRVLSSTATQLVFFWRTWAIAGRRRKPFLVLLTVFLIAFAGQTVAITLFIIPALAAGDNCALSANIPRGITAMYYLVTMLYDLVVFSISSFYLLRVNTTQTQTFSFTRALFHDGLIYMMVATFINVLAVTFTFMPWKSIQTMFSSPAIAIITISGSRMVLNLQNRFQDGTSYNTSSHELSERTTHNPSNRRDIVTIGGTPTTPGGPRLNRHGPSIHSGLNRQNTVTNTNGQVSVNIYVETQDDAGYPVDMKAHDGSEGASAIEEEDHDVVKPGPRWGVE